MDTRRYIISLIIVIGLGLFLFAFFLKRHNEASQYEVNSVESYDVCREQGYPITLKEDMSICTAGEKVFEKRITGNQVNEDQQEQTIAVDSSVTVTVGGSILFANGTRIHLLELNDSRCPTNVECVWAGEISALVEIKTREGESLTHRLGTLTHRTVQLQNNYEITLLHATPSDADFVLLVSPQRSK